MADATVADYMVRDVISVEPQMTVREVTEKMINSNFYGFPIAERGYLLGFVTSKELLRFTDRPDATMREVMKRGTVCVVPSMKISDAIRVLFRYGIRNLPVVDENKKLVGIIEIEILILVKGLELRLLFSSLPFFFLGFQLRFIGSLFIRTQNM